MHHRSVSLNPMPATMAVHNVTPAMSGLARALVQHGRLRTADAENLCSAARADHAGFVEQLITSKRMSPIEIAEFASAAFGLPLFDLDAAEPAHFPADAIDRKLMQTRRVLPLTKRGNRLTLAISDPSNTQALDEVKFQSSMAVDVVVVEDDKLRAAIEMVVAPVEAPPRKLIEDDFGPYLSDTAPNSDKDDLASDSDDAPVVKFIQNAMLDAINDGASDIHFEPFDKFYRVRFRVDGELREVSQPPLLLKEKIASRIKVISRLDISEKRVPQDGRMKLVLSKTRTIEFRVSTLPTLYGEKIVMRVLDPASVKLGIDALGYEPEQKDLLLSAIRRPYGMVLVTGPTGSGKTVSLYTCLNILNQSGINISTVEDPAEINMPGINQVNVNERAGLTFATALRALLRQDPDVIMVGEIRDLETAEIAIKAAQTGHLVLATVHTNDAPTTLTRLLNMGVAPFNIASSVSLITAQRLARRLCTCKAPVTMAREALLQAGFAEDALDGTLQLYGPVGCDRCKNTGYKGRVGIYQVMPVTDEIQRIIMRDGNAIEIAEQAQFAAIRDLRQSGLLKVKQGLTSIEETMACTNA